jgi:predicted RNase H-like HicB family nuclease
MEDSNARRYKMGSEHMSVIETFLSPHNTVCATFHVLIHPCEEGGYWAEVPAIGYCNTQGETIQETESNMYEAVSLCITDISHFKDFSLTFEVCDV